MLAKENMQQSVRLLLLNAFQHSDPELTTMFTELRTECPSLFTSILPRGERRGLAHAAASTLDDDDESELSIMSDDAHIRTAAIGCIQAKFAKAKLNLPLRSAQMTSEFRAQLRSAYSEDYNYPSIYEIGTSLFQWCKKLSFHDRSVLLFVTGNVVVGFITSCHEYSKWKKVLFVVVAEWLTSIGNWRSRRALGKIFGVEFNDEVACDPTLSVCIQFLILCRIDSENCVAVVCQ